MTSGTCKPSLLSVAALAAAVFLVACTTGGSMSGLAIGMSRDQVVQKLGKPDGVKQEGSIETLSWNNRLASGWAWDRADYHVVLQDNKVTEFGQGEVRVKNVGGGVLLVAP